MFATRRRIPLLFLSVGSTRSGRSRQCRDAAAGRRIAGDRRYAGGRHETARERRYCLTGVRGRRALM